MANKLSKTEVADLAADERRAEQVVPAKTRGVRVSGRQKPEVTKRKDKTTNTTPQLDQVTKSGTSKVTKADLILKKLRTARGSSIEMLMADTGWQAHSVRGFLSAVVKKKLALNLVSEVGKDGVRRYRIDGDTKST